VEWIWLALGIFQVFLTISTVRLFRKFSHLQVEELYRAGRWPADLDPPQDEAAAARRFAVASVILSAGTWLLGLMSCMVLFLYAVLATQGQVSENFFGIIYTGMIDIAVLALALGIAALVTRTQRRIPAIAGVVSSAMILIVINGFMILAVMLNSNTSWLNA
jgi:hypothetical protein